MCKNGELKREILRGNQRGTKVKGKYLNFFWAGAQLINNVVLVLVYSEVMQLYNTHTYIYYFSNSFKGKYFQMVKAC